jgi:preprotein translocase subunit SecG
MVILLTIVHVLICLFLVIVVLLQSGKAADLAGAFGGMGSQTAFGPRGAATVLSKATTVAAAMFMVTSLSLSILSTKNAGSGSSVLERQAAPVQKSAPAGPATATPPGAPAPIPSTPGAPQPSVTLDLGDGKTQTVPLDLNKMPRVDPNAPAPAAPAKK